MRIIRLCLIALVVTTFTACTPLTEQRAEEFEGLLAKYQKTANTEDLDAIVEKWPEPDDIYFDLEDLPYVLSTQRLGTFGLHFLRMQSTS